MHFTERSLLKCSCGASLTPTSSQSKGRTYYYYKCTRQNHYGSKTECSTPSIPAGNLEEAVAERVRCLAAEPEHRQRVIEEAYKTLDQDSEKINSDIEAVRKRMTTVQSEIGNLVAALSSLGSNGVESVQGKLVDLEDERKNLGNRLESLIEQRSPHQRLESASREFTDSWTVIGDLLDDAEDQEKKAILNCVVESIELNFLDATDKRAEYRMRVFPEFRPGSSDQKSRDSDLPKLGYPLTTDAKLRQVGEKAPRTNPEYEPFLRTRFQKCWKRLVFLSSRPVRWGCSECAALRKSSLTAAIFLSPMSRPANPLILHLNRLPKKTYEFRTGPVLPYQSRTIRHAD
ncbi:MAG TPA: hypothetical protein DDZ51_22805 [Planctomycetaceae bacterium]|nr:hypothetical protein [Planctomycetaceae bacterium]